MKTQTEVKNKVLSAKELKEYHKLSFNAGKYQRIGTKDENYIIYNVVTKLDDVNTIFAPRYGYISNMVYSKHFQTITFTLIINKEDFDNVRFLNEIRKRNNL